MALSEQQLRPYRKGQPILEETFILTEINASPV